MRQTATVPTNLSQKLSRGLRRGLLVVTALTVAGSVAVSPLRASAATNPCAGAMDAMYDDDTSSKSLHGCSQDGTSPLSLDIDAVNVPVASAGYDVRPGKVFYLATNGSDSNPGTLAQPKKTVQQALDLLPATGGTLVLRGGTYLQGNAGTNKPNVFIQPYKTEQVWFDGTVPVSSSSFKKADSTYAIGWDASAFCGGHFYDAPLKQQIKENNAGPCAHYDNSNDPKNPMSVDPIMVFKDGKYVHEVENLSQAKGDNFYVDQNIKAKTATIHLGFNPSGHKVEITKYPSALKLSGDRATLRGIGFRRYGSNEYDRSNTYSAVYMSGTNATARDTAFKRMAAVGLFINARGGMVSHSVFSSNGFNGVNSNGHRADPNDRKTDGLTIENSLVYNSNTELFSTTGIEISSSRAGSKIANVNSFTVRNNIFYKNNGYGFWCDNDCVYGNIVHNTMINNDRGGILYEVSSKGIIASNLVAGKNKFGIRVCSSDTKVYNNTVVGSFSEAAIWIYDDLRYKTQTDGHIPGIVGPDTTNVEVVNNVVYNDKRMLDITTGDLAKDKKGSTNTPLNALLSTFDYNEWYAVGGSKQIVGKTLDTTDQSKATFYKKLSDERKAIKTSAGKTLDPHALDGTSKNGPFTSFTNRDFTIKSSDKGYKSGTKLPADVAAQLGVSTGTAYSRGAITWPGMK